MSDEFSNDLMNKVDRALDPYRPSRQEILAQHGDLLAAWKQDLARRFGPSWKRQWVALGQAIKLRVLEHMEEVQTGLGVVSSALQFQAAGGVCRTRGLGGEAGTRGGPGERQASPETPAGPGAAAASPRPTLLFRARGDQGSGLAKVMLPDDAHVQFELSLLGDDLRPIAPFLVTVIDAKGARQMDRREFKNSPLCLPPVPLESYRFVLEDSNRSWSVELGFAPASDPAS